MRKVFLDDLLKSGKGKNKGKIEWLSNIGNEIRFIYDDVCGDVRIASYYVQNNRGFLDIEYMNHTYTIRTDGFVNCQLGNLLKTAVSQYKYNINSVVKTKSGHIKILKQIKENMLKTYIYQCVVCGNIDKISEGNLNQNCGCNVCASKKILKGYNDLWSTHPTVANLLVNSKEGYKITARNNDKKLLKCPSCGYEHSIVIDKATTRGFRCPMCGDGVSYPEKFVYNVLRQLNIDFTREKTFDWSKNIKHIDQKLCGNKRYDIFISKINTIIEVHGMQHYTRGFEGMGGMTIYNTKENDQIKRELAKKNNINNYIIIDASHSNQTYLKNSVINSDLSKLFNLSNIDWSKCHQFACDSLVQYICKLWMSNKNIAELAQVTQLSSATIRKYLKQGSELGWSDYDAKKNKQRCGKRKKVICLNNRKIFDSMYEAAEWCGLKTSVSISGLCNNKKGLKTTGKHPETGEKLKWMYYDDYIAQQSTNIKQIS